MKKIVVFGNGKIAIDCLKILDNHDCAQLLLVSYDPNDASFTTKIHSFCNTHSLASAPAPANIPLGQNIIEQIRHVEPDFIFNINGHIIFNKDLLNIPKIGSINFHNGPLPKYRGPGYVIPSWAIFNGEQQHGVTWHMMTTEIDAGDIIADSNFNLSGDETALELIFKCQAEGLKLFEENIDKILNDEYSLTPQKGKAFKYLSNQIPNSGYIDFNWSYEKIDSFLRATNYWPYKNLFTYAKVKHGSRNFIVNKAFAYKLGKNKYQIGEVVDLSEKFLRVAAKDSILEITDVMYKEEFEISIKELIDGYKIKKHDILNYSETNEICLAS